MLEATSTDTSAIVNILSSLAANEFVITVLIPFLVTFLAIFVNWLVQGGRLRRKYAMIGSDLVVCFFAISAIHFFQIYRQNAVSHLDSPKMAGLMLGTFLMFLLTTPALLGCVAMERSSHSGDAPDSWSRLFLNLAVGASPLAVAAFALAT